MKIAYDPQIFCAQTYGGISRYYCEIASHIAKKPGVHVSIIAPMHINSYLGHLPSGIVSGFRAPKTDRFQSNSGINYPRLALRGLSLLMGHCMLSIMKPEVIHETYFSPNRLGGHHARRVLTIYDMIYEKYASRHADKTARYKALAAKRADHVICISESTRRDAIEILGLPPEKTSVIYLGFDLMGATGTCNEKIELPTKDPFLLYVGHRWGHKNFHRLLQAYGTSPQLKAEYKLICFGGGSFQMEEIKTMHTMGLNRDHIVQLGGDDRQLAKLYECASAFIFPSLYEGFGIPPLEAMSYDCPVVCSNTSSIPEIVGNAGEYFNPAEVESMKEAIERVVSSIDHQRLLIARGHERLKCFSWNRCAVETLDVYKQLV